MNQNEIREAKRTLYERRTRMEDLLEQVGDVINGYSKTYENKIINDEGVVDDAHLEELITQIISAAHEDYGPEKEELYRSFLYCTILGIAWKNYIFSVEDLEQEPYEPAQAYGDIVRMARDTGRSAYKDRADLLKAECGYFPYRFHDFFAYAQQVFFLLGGDKENSLFTEEEKAFLEREIKLFDEKRFKAYDEFYAEEEEMKKARMAEDPLYAEEVRQGEELSDAANEALAARLENGEDAYDILCGSLEEEDEDSWWVELARQREAGEAMVLHRIPDAEKYKRYYLRFRELSYTEGAEGKLTWDGEAFAGAIAEMVDLYLYEQKLSAYSLEETYGLVTDSIKRLPGIVREAVRRDGEIEKMKKRALEKVMYAGEREELFPKYAAGYIFDLSLKNADGIKCNAALEEFLMDSGFLTASEQAVMRGIANGDGYDEIGVRLHRKAWEIEKIEKRAREKMMYAQDREELFPRGVLG